MQTFFDITQAQTTATPTCQINFASAYPRVANSYVENIACRAFFLSPAIGAGLMFGGIFSVCDGYFNYWSELSATLKFFSLLAAFVVLIVVGYRKIERKAI